MNQNRPVWDEGMMLSPQHFQQLERWCSAELFGRARSLVVFSWGFSSWELDTNAMGGGEVAVRRCEGFFVDGTSFACPDRERLPAPRSALDVMSPEQPSIMAYLAVPIALAGATAYGDGSTTTQWVRDEGQVADACRPERERGLVTARANLSIRFDGESLEGFRTLPLARLQRREGGGVQVVESFSPPALTMHASPVATGVLRDVTGMLTQKWTDLAGQRRGTGGSADVASLLLLNTVGSCLPVMRHILTNGMASPEDAYLELAKLAAQLCTFHPESRAIDVPAYDHVDVGSSFGGLSEMLKQLLGDAAPSRCAQIRLDQVGESLFTALVPTPDMLTSGRLYLAVKANMPEEEMQMRFGAMTKVTSKDRIQDLLVRAVAGLPVRTVPQPPQSIPVQPGRSYFVLEPGGEHWDAITASQTVAIHVAPGFPELTIELLAARD